MRYFDQVQANMASRKDSQVTMRPSWWKKFSCVKLVAMDVDGVLTDACVYYSSEGEELKKFNMRDGKGIALLHNAGIKTAIITSENSPIVLRRAEKLNIEEVWTGVEDKLRVIKALINKYHLQPIEVLYIGDDINDLEVLQYVGVPVCVQDAVESVKKVCCYITAKYGGNGAVREVVDLILASR